MNRLQSGAIARLCACVSILLLVTACVTTPPRQAYNREANSQTKSISVLPARASEPQVLIMNNPGAQFGLIGALVAEANLAGKRQKLRTQLTEAGFDQDAYLREVLGSALEKRGYTVAWPERQVEEPNQKVKRDQWGLRKAYAASSEPQMQLDINYGFIGYAAAGASKSAPYRPTVVVSARMKGADGKSTLFTDMFVYNNVFPALNDAVMIEPDSRFVYPDFDDLDAANAQSADGLRAAIAALADKIAERL
jgi:hypothetical protein